MLYDMNSLVTDYGDWGSDDDDDWFDWGSSSSSNTTFDLDWLLTTSEGNITGAVAVFLLLGTCCCVCYKKCFKEDEKQKKAIEMTNKRSPEPGTVNIATE